MAWDPLTQPVDKAVFAGRPTPGLCEVLGAGSARKWEENGGYGMSGAILVYRGIALCHFDLNLTLWNDDHWAEWEQFREVVQRPPLGRFARASQIYHPVLNEAGIHACVIENVTAPEQIENGVWQIVIKCIEWRVYKLSQSKPDGAEATPVDPRQAKIGDLAGEAGDVLQDLKDLIGNLAGSSGEP